MMNDWSIGVEDRNYKIAHRIDSRNVADLLASILCFVMLAGAMTFCVWTRYRNIALGYELQTMKEAEQSLVRLERRQILDEELLKNPERIDSIARNELAMEPMEPYQRITAGISDMEGGAAVMTLVNALPPRIPPRKISANN